MHALGAHARRPRLVLRDVAVLALTAAFAFQTIPPFDHGNVQIDAMRLHRLSDVYRLARDADGAIASLLEAMAICPERCPGELRALVALYEQAGLSREAVAWLEQLIAAHPHNRAAVDELARLRAAGW